MLRYILFHHQTTTIKPGSICSLRCVISSFITKPQQPRYTGHKVQSCVISSFITKPQLCRSKGKDIDGCVISSFITKPQHVTLCYCYCSVALYPLSSPNHNCHIIHFLLLKLRYILFHHQTTTLAAGSHVGLLLRYILFHHQTTTCQSVFS